jgi:hypothetical protein
VHAASASGGGRAASVAALIGVCISGVGAGTYCVATLVLPDPKPIVRAESKPAKRGKPSTAKSESPRRGPGVWSPIAVTLPAVTSVTPSRTETVAQRHPRATRRRNAQPTPDSDEFSFEQGGASSPTPNRSDPRTGSASSLMTRPPGSERSGGSPARTEGSHPSGTSEFDAGVGGEFAP